MQWGEALKLVAVLGALGAGGYGLGLLAQSLGAGWSARIDEWPGEPDDDGLRAAALVPEYAASRWPLSAEPIHANRRAACARRNCRERYNLEPCSDFEE